MPVSLSETLLVPWHQLVLQLPFAWAEFEFMRIALLGVLIITPLFALAGTLVINNRMAFFSDVLGHSALTGVAVGVLVGLTEPLWAMVIFSSLLAIVFNLMKRWTSAASDTVLGVLFSTIVAFGIVILSRNGGFSKFTSYLIGDVLAVTPNHIILLLLLFVILVFYWLFFGNRLLMVSVNPTLAKSRGFSPFLLETSFSLVLAVLVTLSIKMVGVLIISALLVLPAAGARNLAHNIRSYTFLSVALSLVAGILGLIVSFYCDTASGGTIILVAALLYIMTAIVSMVSRAYSRHR